VVESPFARVNARREDALEQMSLTITLDREGEPVLSLLPEQRLRLMDLMAAAIIAVHRASQKDAREEGHDDDARE
jgi:hypothetical protein